jgi:hypothetical protein
MQPATWSHAGSRNLPFFVCIVRRLFVPALLALCACTAASLATAPQGQRAPLKPVMSFYPDAGVFTSSRDTCPSYNEAPELADVFWDHSDSALVNPDSVWAADSAEMRRVPAGRTRSAASAVLQDAHDPPVSLLTPEPRNWTLRHGG